MKKKHCGEKEDQEQKRKRQYVRHDRHTSSFCNQIWLWAFSYVLQNAVLKAPDITAQYVLGQENTGATEMKGKSRGKKENGTV